MAVREELGNFDIPYFQPRKRGGKTYFYWEPSRRLRALGYEPISLGTDLQRAVNMAMQINTGLGKTREIETNSVHWLINLYRKDDRYLLLSPRTKSDYDRILGKLEQTIGTYQVPEVTRAVCKAIHRDVVDAVRKRHPDKPHAGLTEAAHVVQVLRVLLGVALDEGIILTNPARELNIKKAPARDQVWDEAEMDAFVVKAREMGRESIALAFTLARFLGQRPADIRALQWHQYDGKGIALKQRKTKKPVDVKCLLELKAVLDSTERRAVQIVVSEETKQPYGEQAFMRWVQKIRDGAGIRKELQFKDLRRTAVVNLFRAGANIGQIVSITGHDITSCQAILDTYFPRDSEAAGEGVTHMENYRRRKSENGSTEK